ncbi:MAG: alpha/beta hydrolase [Chloroflexi bacterium]|nr:alpha/beta hydrolase [Chloroflexota bacterium]MCH8348950.1 alpha/beta hydrolase [Chloroflexota bacterium]MCI0780127.1 alpha/beta hydrolase [Chloroflexota bacterium]MCI0792771.1 alpha/beta hydrolase [Chloroflexota bacterium]MCI0798146.1 alpha/beta hydrolase [Chloroflexota bacterium]
MPTQVSPPTSPAELWADIGGLQMRYLDWGGDGPPVMALHGLASSAHWYDLVAPLLQGQYRVISPDQRGHGQTTQATSGYDWKTLSADVVALMDHLGVQQAAVLGHSWGGNVAISVAARYPDRVSRLVMIEGGFLGGPSQTNATWEEFSNRVRPRNISGNREEFLDRLRTQLADCWSDELERIVQTMVYEDGEGQIQDILHPDNHAQVIRQMWDEPPSTILPDITCPTLLVAAEPRPERANSEFAQRRIVMVAAAAEVLKNGRVHWIPNTIHDIGYDKPVELAGLIKEFLAEE